MAHKVPFIGIASQIFSSSSTPVSSLDQPITVHSDAHSLAHELAIALMLKASGGRNYLQKDSGYNEGVVHGIDNVLGTRDGDEGEENDGVHGGTGLADEFGGELGKSYAGDVDEE